MPQKSVTVAKDISEFGGDSEELKRLRSTHTLYELYVQQWSLYLGAYEGGPDFANEQNIFRHFRENEDDFRDRTRRIHYLNYCEPIVDFYTNFIFSETIDRDGGDAKDFFQDFILDVNRKGDTINTYMRKVSDETQVFGMVYTLVDAPPTPQPGQVITKQQEQEMGIRPYWVFMRPDEVMDWAVDDFENFIYLKRREIKTHLDPQAKSPATVEVYTEWYEDRIVTTQCDITDPTHPILAAPVEVVNTMGMIPIHVHRYKRSRRYPFVGNSFLRDFAYNNREIMNLTSLLQEFLYRQCFNLLAKEVESSIPITSQQDGIFGTSNVLEYPKGAKQPQYLTPPADPAHFIQEERELIKQEMFARASQDLKQLGNGSASSGFSQAQSFSKTVPFIAVRASNLEHDENALMGLTMKRMNKKWNGTIKYKDHYEITNVTDAMTQFMTLARDLQLPSETFTKVGLLRLVKQYDNKFPADVMNKITTEIQGMDFGKWQEIQKEALVGAPKSPGEQQKPKSSGTMAEIESEAKTPNTAATKKLKNS